jgi:hypothetical protein
MIKNKNMSESIHWGLLGVLGLLLFYLIWSYGKNVIVTRNEAEYRDIVEYQTMLVAALVHKNPKLIPEFQTVRYFPDQSGFFIILDFDGTLLVHGDYSGDLTQPLPFNWPVTVILDTAKNGGGYIRYNYKGYVYESFIYIYPGSSYIVCSGLFNDHHHIQQRLTQWKRTDRTLLKSGPSAVTTRRKPRRASDSH